MNMIGPFTERTACWEKEKKFPTSTARGAQFSNSHHGSRHQFSRNNASNEQLNEKTNHTVSPVDMR